MPSYQLSDIRTHTSNYQSIAPPSLRSILDSSPEPTTTASGIVPGQALFDNYESALEPVSDTDNSSRRYSQRTRTRNPKASQHDQDTAILKAKRETRRRRNSAPTTIVSDGLTDTEYVSDSTRDPRSDGLDGISGTTAHPMAPNGRETIPAIPAIHQPSLHMDVLPNASTPGVSGVHASTLSDQRLGSFEGGSQSSGSGRISRASSTNSGAVEQTIGLPPDFWAFSLDHKQLEHDIERLQHADLNTISQLPPEHLLVLIRELAAEHGGLIGRQTQVEPNTSQPGTSPSALQQPSTSQQTPSQQAASRQTSSQQTLSQQETVKTYRRSAIQAGQVQPPRNRKAEAQPVANQIKVGGGHHLDQPRLNLTRPGSHSYNPPIENTDTETESETELENQPTRLGIPYIRNPLPNQSNRPSNLPSPLPSAHIPINPSLHSTLDFPANPHLKAPGSSQRSTQPQTAGTRRAPQPLFRQLTATTDVRLISRPRSAATSVSLGQPVHGSRTSSQRNNPAHLPASASSPGSASVDDFELRTAAASHIQAQPQSLGVARPRGTAKQESSRLRRAAKKRANSKGKSLNNLPIEMRQSTNLIRARREPHGASGSTSTQRRRPSAPDLMEDDQEQRVMQEAITRGEQPQPGRKKKPSARDIHGNERQVLTHAKLHLYAYSVVEGPFQTRGVVEYWSHPVWDLSWVDNFPELPIEAPSPETIRIMIDSQPTFRGQVKEPMRSLVEHIFGFIKPATTPEAIEHNVKLCRMLSPNGFHHISLDPLDSPYEGDAVYQAIAVVLFRTPSSVGVLFPGYYNPCPLTGAAFAIANMQHAIEEYSTGHFRPRDLNATLMLGKFVAHLRGLKTAARRAKKRFSAIQLKWYKYGYDYSGATQLEDPFTQPVISADDVRPDTPTEDDDFLPETDHTDENDSEVDKNGRYTKRAKGKGRA